MSDYVSPPHILLYAIPGDYVKGCAGGSKLPPIWFETTLFFEQDEMKKQDEIFFVQNKTELFVGFWLDQHPCRGLITSNN